ncbi:MAG: hypothetical protein HC794_09855 [Nitrospiraceae bacterium]|nr:hypothetical protein [Nitrospiraceae bacterium]
MQHGGKERISPLNAHELDERDPDYRENYAVLELLRSLSIGKMVTVVGSGVTTIYGYMNWEGFISSLIEDFRKWAQSDDFLDNRGRQIFDGIYANYKDRDRDDKNTSTEHIAVLGELVESLTDKGKEEYLENLRIYFTQTSVITMDAVAERYRSLLAITETNVKEKRPLPADVSGLLALMPGSPQVGTAAGPSSAIDSNSNSSSRIRKPRNVIDPLIRIRKELDISRFVTFNYDLELEKMLEDLDYPFGSLSGKKGKSGTVLTAHSRIGAIGKSISLTEENASELIALAAMPTAANDVIVHVHGSIGNPEKMIVTQRDYNQRYFDPYPGRETFEDAQSLLFGGNSVIYAGVGLSEEDLMRPLRYLRSNDKKAPHLRTSSRLDYRRKSKIHGDAGMGELWNQRHSVR